MEEKLEKTNKMKVFISHNSGTRVIVCMPLPCCQAPTTSNNFDTDNKATETRLEKQSKDALVKQIIYQFGYQIYNHEHTVLNTKQLFNEAQFGSLRQICNYRLTDFAT